MFLILSRGTRGDDMELCACVRRNVSHYVSGIVSVTRFLNMSDISVTVLTFATSKNNEFHSQFSNVIYKSLGKQIP